MFFITTAFIDVETDNFRALREITFGELLDALEAARKRALARRQAGELVMEIDPEAIFNSGIRLKAIFAELALTENGNFILTEDVFGNLFQVVSAPSDEVQFRVRGRFA
jgi:hypothetical protein